MNVAQASPALHARMEQGINRLIQDIQGLTDRVHPAPTQGGVHISHLVVHPNFVLASTLEATSSSQSPFCCKVFDVWSGTLHPGVRALLSLNLFNQNNAK